MAIDFKRNLSPLCCSVNRVGQRFHLNRGPNILCLGRERQRTGFSISAYFQQLQDHYQVISRLEHVDECIVEEMMLFKETPESEEEVIVAKVRQHFFES
ncbi:hypothetical protein BDN70DRAFT_871511 [Pholiota conissans]|uniref:Uncharacterized protein n=1 Tax=Pholiota conissans TaxID=109636 RepID=A0A9P5ZBG2_9AGAR|nr:hypothetical protein BDN70DRAFT_871511 [Pholiota conissans]